MIKLNRQGAYSKIIIVFLVFSLLLCGSSIAFANDRKFASGTNDYANTLVAKNNISSIQSNYSFSEGNGIKIKASGAVASFYYKNLVNANMLDENFSLIKVIPLAGDGFSYLKKIEVRLVDEKDESNYVGAMFTPAGTPEKADCSYVLGSYSGIYRAKAGEILYEDVYGEVGWGLSFNPLLTFYSPFDMRLSYAKKAVYFRHTTRLTKLLQLDNGDQVGRNKIWQGFTTDFARLEVHLEFEETEGEKAVVVTEVMNQIVKDEWNVSHEKAPEVYIQSNDLDLQNMPISAVNLEYDLPKAFGYDWYFGNSEVTVTAFLNGADVTSECIKGFQFTPKSKGKYTFKYNSQNSFATNFKEFNILVYDKLPQYHVYFRQELSTPKLMEYFYLPEVNVSGGSGKIEYSESIQYNNRKVELDDSRLIYINQTGFIKFSVLLKSFVGEEYVKTFIIDIKPSGIDIIVKGMPKAIKKDSEIELPTYEVLDFTGTSGAITTEIFADNVKIDRKSRKFSSSKANGEIVVIKYTATKGVETATKSFELFVIDSSNRANMFLSGGNCRVNVSDFGADIIAQNGKESVMNMPFPISVDNINIIFKIKTACFESFDIVLNDFYNNEIEKTIRITPNDSKTSYLQVDGKGEKYLVKGSFLTGNEQFNILFSSRDGKIFDSDGALICQAKLLPSLVGNISFKMNNITAFSEVSIKQIGNQMLSGIDNKPMVLCEKAMKNSQNVEMGQIVTVSNAKAYDVFDYGAKLSIKIIAPDDSIVYEGECKNMTFKAEQYGFYKVNYQFDYNGKTYSQSHFVKVIDRIAPTIKQGKLTQIYNVNDTFTLPEIVVEDNFDNEVYVYTVILEKRTMQRTIVTDNSYVFKQSGDYEFIIVAQDATGNICSYKNFLTVK